MREIYWLERITAAEGQEGARPRLHVEPEVRGEVIANEDDYRKYRKK